VIGDSLKSRWGFTLERQKQASRLYALVNLSYERLDGTVTDVSGTAVARQNNRLWAEIDLRGQVQLRSKLSLYAEATGRSAPKDFGDSYGLKANAGVRLAL